MIRMHIQQSLGYVGCSASTLYIDDDRIREALHRLLYISTHQNGQYNSIAFFFLYVHDESLSKDQRLTEWDYKPSASELVDHMHE